jgi:hypothetical protein
MFLQTEPGAECEFHPQGAASPKDGTHADISDGRVRFFAPPTSWGSALEAACTIGSKTQHFLVNLKDPSTYELEPELFQPSGTSVLPALTGDLLAIPAEEVLGRGYPPRPNPAANPAAYERWVSIVTTPRTIQSVKWVAALGRYGSNYVGTFTDEQTTTFGAWTGRVLAPGGWGVAEPGGGTCVNCPILNTGTTYAEYVLTMQAPANIDNCPGGNDCTAFLWSGMGGYNDPAGANAGLIQSGVVVQNNSAPFLVVEYYPNGWMTAFGGPTISPGQELLVWGWSSPNASCTGTLNETGPVACYGFYNETTGVLTEGWNTNKPANTTFTGATGESVAEMTGGVSYLTDFGWDLFQDYYYDYHGNYHDVTTDKWIFNNAFSEEGRQVAQAYYPDGTDNNEPAFEVQWLRGQ